MNIFISILITAIAYMLFPLARLLYDEGRFNAKTANRIALWNSIVVGAIFFLLTAVTSGSSITWSAAPAILYYGINRAILTKKCFDNDDTDAAAEHPIINDNACPNCGRELALENRICQYCGTPVRRKRPLIILAAFLCVIFAFGAVALFLGYNDGEFNLSNISISITPVRNVGVRTITFSDRHTAECVMNVWFNSDTTEDSMIAIMDEFGEEQGGGKLHIIVPGEYVEEVDKWCFNPKRKPGDVILIENVFGYTLCYFSGKNLIE